MAQSAGQLEIEIMASVARLQDDMRRIERTVGQSTGRIAKDAKAANDNLRNIGRGAGQGVQQYSRDVAQLKAQLDPAWAAAQRFRQQQLLANQAFREGAISAKQLVEQLRANAAAYQNSSGKMVQSVNAQRAGFQQLGFQLQDFVVQTAGGTSAVRAFSQQMPQAIGAVQLMLGSTSRLGAFLGGPWGIAVAVAAAALGPLIEHLWKTKDAADGARTALQGLRKERQQAAQEQRMFTDLQSEYVGLKKRESELEDAIARKSRGRKQADGTPMFAFKEYQELQALRREKRELQSDMDFKLAKDFALPDFSASKDADKATGSTRALTAATTGLTAAQREQNKAVEEAKRQYEQAVESATNYASSLEKEAANLGKTAIEIKRIEVAANAAAAPTEQLRQRILEAGQAWEKATRAQADADFQNNVIKPLQDELALLGLVGPARELAALALEEQAFKAKAARDGITDVNKAWEEYLRLRKDIINGKSAMEREREEAELLNDQLRDMIGLLGELGSVGSAIGGLLGVLTGNTRSVGGPIGDLLNTQIGGMIEKTRADGTVDRLPRTIGDEIANVFDKDSDFGKVISGLTNVLQGAGSGMIAASALFGNQSGAQKIGGALGGALGQVAGQALGKAIGGIAGSLGGPIGSILGGIAGSVLGGLFGSKPPPPSGSGSVSNTGLTSTANNAQIAASLDSFGGAVQSTIMNIADQLGGKVGDYAIGMGRHREWYQVSSNANDPYLGQGYYDKKSPDALYDGVDAEAALRIAIKEIIRQGAIEGVSAGVQTLIGKGDDIERQLAKAIKFEGVFDELKQATDPLGYNLDGFARQLEELTDIFEEAGATAEEYAKLEQLYAIKRRDAIANEFRERADMEVEILRLLGREQDALNLARESELSGIKDSLKPLQQMIYTLQDARAIIDQFQPLSDSLKAFKNELLGGGARESFSFLKSQFQSTASAAAGGDAAAMAKLQDVSTAYLDAARENAASRYDYDRAVGEVLASVDKGIFAADAQVEYAQMQIDAVNYNSEILDQMRSQMAAMQQRLVDQGDAMNTLMRRIEAQGLRVITDDDTTIRVEVVP